jgi:coenzyme PQQ precursor peptide PqqA
MAHWRWPGARTMATLAYCLYLTNKQVFYWVDVHADLDAAPALARKLLAAFAVAGLLHLLVERPGLAPRAGVPSPHPACSLLIHRWHVRSGGRHARRDGTDIARISVQLLAHPSRTEETTMKWTKPECSDWRFGFEITLYIANR